MVKHCVFILVAILSALNCSADTFTHLVTHETFNGYPTQKKRGAETQVRIENKSPRFLDLSNYQIERNNLGRNNIVYVFSIKNEIELIVETEAFENAIAAASNRGPLFILIEIDTPGGRAELAQRICEAIIKTDNCDTIAFVNGGKFGGAFSHGAIVALACDKVYMKQNTSIGGRATAFSDSNDNLDYFKPESVISVFQWQQYASKVAKRNNRSGLLVSAMVDKRVEVFEMMREGKLFIADRRHSEPNQALVRVLADKNSLLGLTADDAGRYGIADKVSASKEQLLTFLGADKAKLVRDRHMVRARSRFERAKRRFDTVLTSIRSLEVEATSISTEFKTIRGEILKFSEKLLYESYGIVENGMFSYPNTGMIPEEWNDILSYKNDLLSDLSVVLDDLIRNYRRAIPLAQKHSDLNFYAEILKNRLDVAETQYQRIMSRPRLFY